MLKKGKTGNHNGQQNRKTEVFLCKNRKTDLKNGQNRKTENPNAPLFQRLTRSADSVNRPHIISASNLVFLIFGC